MKLKTSKGICVLNSRHGLEIIYICKYSIERCITTPVTLKLYSPTKGSSPLCVQLSLSPS